MWSEHKLTMNFTTELCGGRTRYGKIVDDWVRLRAATNAGFRKLQESPPGPDGKPPRSLEEVAVEAHETLDPLTDEIEEATQKRWVGFSRDERGLFVRGGNIRAHFKDAATALARILRQENNPLAAPIKMFAHKVKECVYVKEDRVYVCSSADKVYTEPSGNREATMSVMTAQGPRTCLKRIDFCHPARLCATIQLLEGAEITLGHVKLCFDYGMVQGFGQDRSLGYGRYTWTLE